MIIVDKFEVVNNPKTKEQLDKINVSYQVQSLISGDYLIEGDVANIIIERKEISDLFSSNHEGRLQKQMEKMLVEYSGYKKILLVEGNISSVVHRRVRRKKGEVVDFGDTQKGYARYSAEFSGIISSIIATSDINVIQTASKWQTITVLKTLDEWANGRRRAERRAEVVKNVDRTVDRESEDVLLSIKGIGWKKTREIFSSFSSISEIFTDILENDSKKLKEVLGDNLAKHVSEVFTNKIKKVD